jgi:hypothetical protein
VKWIEVRELFPNRCVLVESLQAKTINNERIIDEMSVIDDFDNGNSAWKVYKEIHNQDRTRELYIFHTNNEEVKVIEQQYLGVRRRI